MLTARRACEKTTFNTNIRQRTGRHQDEQEGANLRRVTHVQMYRSSGFTGKNTHFDEP